MGESTSGPDLFNQLADEFAERYRQGECPSLSEYTDKYPELAGQIRELFPALVAIERFGTGADQATGPFAPRPGVAGPIPERLGDHRILREIARGGMGIVYEAIQESLGRHVALKVLPQHRLADPNQLERFQREARAAAMLHHTNIVPVFGVGEHDGVHYYAMQYIQGQSLDAVLREVKRLRGGSPAAPATGSGHDPALAASVALELVSGRFAPQSEAPSETESLTPSPPADPAQKPPTPDLGTSPGASPSALSILGRSESSYSKSVARIGVQAAEALAYAHHHKLLHRDVKPSNLLLDMQGTVWVTDFGLAKAEGADALTHTGDIVGTLRYMAPERFQGQADPRSDVYALGLTLYEMLTLAPAFMADERARLIDTILRDEPPKPRQVDPSIPRDLETVVLKAMAKEPADRYRTASELAEDLRRYLADRPILARRPSLLDRAAKWARRRPGIAASVVAMLVLAVVGLAVSNALIRREMRRTDRKRAEADQKAEALRRQDYINRVNLAYRECQADNVAQALDLLDGCPQDLRAFEWFYVKRQCHLDLHTFREPALAVNAVAFSPDGRLLASGSGDYLAGGESGDLVVRDAATGREVFAHRGLPGSIRAVAFSPDGRWVAAGQATWAGSHRGDAALVEFSNGVRGQPGARPPDVKPAGTLTVWDATTGRKRFHTIDAGRFGISSVAFSPDSRRIIAGYADSDAMHKEPGYAKLWDAATGTVLVDRIPSPGHGPNSVAFSRDGKHVALAGVGQVDVWDVASHKLVRTLSGHTGRVLAVDFSSDGRHLATGGDDNTIRVWERATGAELRTYFDEAGVGGLAFSHDGQRIVSASGNGLKLWSVASGELAAFHGHQLPVTCVAFSPDGSQIASASADQTVKLWYATKDHQLTIQAQRGPVRSLAFSPDGHSIISAADDGVFRLSDSSSGEPRLVFEQHIPMGAVAFSPDGSRVASAQLSATVRIWDATTGRKILTLIGTQPHDNVVWPSLAFSSESRLLAYADNDRSVKVWDAGTGRMVHTLHGHSAPVNAVAFSPVGRILASAGDDKTVKVWDVATGREVLTLKGHVAPVFGLAFSPDGQQFAAVGGNFRQVGEVRVWDSSNGRELAQLHGHTERVWSAAFSPDGRRLATAGDDRAIKFWDTATGQEVFTLRGHTISIHCVAFSHDGRRLVSGSVDSTVKVWDLDENQSDVLSRRDAVAQADAGESLLEQGRWDQAVAALSRALELKLDNPGLRLARGRAFARLGQRQKAEADFAQGLKLAQASGAVEWTRALGESFLQLGRWELAVAAFTRAMALKLDTPQVRLARGRALARLGQFQAAEVDFAKALDLLRGDAGAPMIDNEGVQTFELRQFGHAQRILAFAFEREPGQLPKAEVLLRESVKTFEKIVGKQPRDVEGLHFIADNHRRLAWVLNTRGQRDAALAEYQKAIRLHEERLVTVPDSSFGAGERAQAYFEYARLLSRAGQVAEARAQYEKGLGIEPNSARDCNNFAWLLATAPDPTLRDPARAVRLARKSVKLEPKNSNFWNTLGAALYRAGDWSGAIDALLKSNELGAKGSLGFNGYFLALAHQCRGEPGSARIWFDVASRWHRRSAPADEELRRFRAEALGVLGLGPEAHHGHAQEPADDATLGRLVLQADPTADWARVWLGKAAPGRAPIAGPTREAPMPDGLNAFARE